MPASPFVDEGVIRAQQVERAPSSAGCCRQELRFLPQGLRRLSSNREETHIRSDRIELRKWSHCEASGHQRSRTRVGQHPPRPVVRAPPGRGEFLQRRVEQFIVRNAAPQKKGQADASSKIAECRNGVSVECRRVLFDAEQELWITAPRTGPSRCRLEASSARAFRYNSTARRWHRSRDGRYAVRERREDACALALPRRIRRP